MTAIDTANNDDAPIELTIPFKMVGMRLDKYLSTAWPQFSRTRLKALIEQGQVRMNDALMVDASYKVRGGEVIELNEPAPIDADPIPENIPLDIVYEDDDLLVINKDADMVVHPAAGHATGTLVHALLYHCGDTLSGVGGVKRPGIVHRLDRGTSGLMLVAKHDRAHIALQSQLSDRTLGRIYHAIVFGTPVPPAGVIDKPIGRHPTQRLKMVVAGQSSREAVTHYRTLEKFGNVATLVECKLATGRTHQIRVHMGSMGNPLLGDMLYGPQDSAVAGALKRAGLEPDEMGVIMGFARQALHAAEIHFNHPITGAAMSFTAAPPPDFERLYKSLKLL